MKSKVTIGDNRLEMVRVFDAPRERVFAAWKEVDLIQQWWGCKQTSQVESEVDFAPGGAFTHRMQIDGCGECLYVGTFEDIIEPEKISYHAEFGGSPTYVVVQFIDLGAKTKLILTQQGFPSQDTRPIIAEGFNAGFDKLERLVIAQAV